MAEVIPEIDICSIDVDGHLHQIQQNLPKGRAWPRDPDTTLMRYWRSFAETIKYLEDRVCALIPEFYCSTAVETIDIWAETYGVFPPDEIDYAAPCLKPEYLDPPLYGQRRTLAPEAVCAKVSATGGSSCEYFQSVAAATNWVVECVIPENSIPMAGCAYCGCSTTSTAFETVDNEPLAFGGIGLCDFGAGINHPFPEFWETSADRSDCLCPVPGSVLGVNSQQCCLHCGYFETEDAIANDRGSACLPQPAQYDLRSSERLNFRQTDKSGKFLAFNGHAYVVSMLVDVPATLAAMDEASPYDRVWSMSGCLYCGDPCAASRNLDPELLDASLSEIMPAHLRVNVMLNDAYISPPDGYLFVTDFMRRPMRLDDGKYVVIQAP